MTITSSQPQSRVKAGIIVTGDKDLLALVQFRSVRILTARDFLAELGPDTSGG
jgi:predicted nucleic acid-binding protein